MYIQRCTYLGSADHEVPLALTAVADMILASYTTSQSMSLLLVSLPKLSLVTSIPRVPINK